MSTVSYTLKPAYTATYIGGLVHVDDSRDFNVKTALDAGAGTVTIDATDAALVSALDSYYALQRSGSSTDPAPLTETRSSLLVYSDGLPGKVAQLLADGSWRARYPRTGADPVAFGADPTGATDSTAAVLAAAAAMYGSNAVRPVVRLGAGTYKLNLTALERIDLEGLSSDLTSVIPTSPTSPIIQAGGFGALQDQKSYINKVRFHTNGANRAHKYPLLDFTLTRNLIFGDDVFFDVEQVTVCCLRLDGAYQCRLNGVHFRVGKFGLPVEWTNLTGLPSQQIVAARAGDFTDGTKTITNIPTNTNLKVGDAIVGTHVQARTVIRSVTGTGPYTITTNKKIVGTQAGGTFDTYRTPQNDTCKFDMQVDGCVAMIARDAQNECHGFNYFGKCVQTTYYPTWPSQMTTLPAGAAEDDTSVAVADATGIVAGDLLVADAGLDACEMLRVDTSYAGGLTGAQTIPLHSSTPVRFDHLAGAEVHRGGVGFSFGDGHNSHKWHEWHFEGQQIAVAAGSVAGMVFLAPYKGAGRLVHITNNVRGLKVVLPVMMGSPTLNELVRRSSNCRGTSDGEWFCDMPNVPSGVAVTPAVPDDYFPHTTRGWTLRIASGGALQEHRNTNTATKVLVFKLQNTEKASVSTGGRITAVDAAQSKAPLIDITGKTSAQIDALFSVTPTDGMVVPALDSGNRITMERDGGKWYIGAALTLRA